MHPILFRNQAFLPIFSIGKISSGVRLKLGIHCIALIAALAAGAPAFAAGELSSVPLIATKKYDPTREQNRGGAEFLSAIGGAVAGIFVDVPAKIEAEAQSKLATPEMAKYFSSRAEREQIAKRISAEAKRKYLANGTSNKALIQATQFAANEIIRTVVNRVMETEGARDAQRRGLWIEKILAPINSCINASKAYSEATTCLETFQADIGSNLGQAIGYELINQELGPQLARAFPARYVKCLQPEKAGADKRMMGCVLDNVRKSIAGYGKDKALLIAQKEVPNSAAKIVAATGPAFEKCLSTAKTKDDFRNCADRFSIATGSEIAAEAVRINPQVQKQISGAGLEALVKRTRENFAACMENNLTENKRDAAGGIETAACANLVRYDAAKVVAYELFRQNIAANVSGSKEEKEKFGTRIYRLLDACWNSSQGEAVNNACLRSTVQQLVSQIADPQLTKELPAPLIAREPRFKEGLLTELRSCLESRLPTNMMEADDTNERVAGCTGKITRAAGLKVAEFQFREILFGRTKDTRLVDRMVNDIIKKDFGNCLGESPVKAVLDRCSIQLRIDAGKGAAEALIPAEVDRFFDSHGGMGAYGLNRTTRTRLIDDYLDAHRTCLDVARRPTDPASADALVDVCFKATIKGLTAKLAHMEFLRSVSAYNAGGQTAWTQTADELARDLKACLGEKDPPQFTLRDFLIQVESCRVRLTTTYTEKVARAQLRDALQKNLPSATAEEKSKQEQLELSLMAPFQQCVGKVEADDAAGVDSCVRTLQKEAILTIATDAARERSKKILNTPNPPPEVQALEDAFKKCIRDGTNSDSCAKIYARSMAKFLAGVKMRQSLADVLGKDRYLATLPAAEASEKEFVRCVDKQYNSPLDSAFMDSLDGCSKRLEEDLVGLLQTQFISEMQKNKSGKAADLSLDLAMAVPCFGDLLPGNPIESAIVALDPASFLEDFTKLIGDFINYDVDKAGLDYQAVLSQLAKDMEAAGPVEARNKLMKLLIERGMVDRLLKSMVRARVVENLKTIPKEDKLTPELEAQLLNKETIEKAMSPEVLNELRPIITEKVLKPLLIQGKGMNDAGISAAMRMLEAKVMNKLIESPHFGDLIAQSKIQQSIDSSTNMFTRFTGWMFAGYKTFTWSEARTKPAGKAAEEYLKQQIIRPRLDGQTIPDYPARMKKVEEMVREALKKP